MNNPQTELYAVLKRYWGYDSFRPMQRDAIDCALTNRDSVVVLPTGGGKSLCFQVPALMMPGIALVVSPLISLMKDQVDALKAAGAPAECIHSGMTLSERREVDRSVKEGRAKLLYVSPERLAQSAFVDYLRSAGVSFVAIDEAHCISQWGHDFRPEYRQLRALREAFPGAALHAYTATATPQVRDDIVQELSLKDPRVMVGSFDRPNLFYRVIRRSSLLDQVRAVVDRYRGETGIVYCLSRKNVDEMSSDLRALGYNALPYHAGMDDASRKRNQDAFARDEANIIVATIAFGMGIDKSNVRFVIHAGLPKSIEHFQQETGRAGRDGLPSECWLFYTTADFMMWKRMTEKSEGEGAAVAIGKLNDMLQFASSMQCRRRALLEYFGEMYARPKCDACDVCNTELESHADAGKIARAILECVGHLGDYAGPTYTAQVLSGSREERIVRSRATALSSYGALRDESVQNIRNWIEQLVAQEYLLKRGEYNILSPGPQLADDPTLECAIIGTANAPAKKVRKSATAPLSTIDQELFDELRALRKRTADSRGVAAFLILSDASLNDMARKKPTSLQAFRQIHGIGERKAADFGEAFTAVIRAYCDTNGLRTLVPDSESKPAARAAKPRAQDAANQMFAERRSIEDVMEALQRARATVEGYFAEYLEGSGITDPEPWATVETLEKVRAAVGSAEDGRLKPIHEALNGEVPYTEIRVCLACIRNGG